MKKQLLLITLLTFCIDIIAQDLDYHPYKVGDNQILEYTQFSLSYNEQHEQADWVSYELTAEEVAAKLDRCDCFNTDDNVATGSSSEKDYSSTGFDKGHLCPAADNNISEQANKESFLMSNMSPQLPQFNRGIWADLESWVRKQATEYQKLYVVTGPVFVNNLGRVSGNIFRLRCYLVPNSLLKNNGYQICHGWRAVFFRSKPIICLQTYRRESSLA